MSSIVDEYRNRLRSALGQLQDMEAQLDALRSEPIAVIGSACRFPGDANSAEAFFELLDNHVDAVVEVPKDRWPLPPDDAGQSASERAKRWGAFVKDIDQFDASFFGISPREAIAMDPQQRILLELAWEALEHAGQVPERLSGSNVGVFLGIVQTDNLLKCASRPSSALDFYDSVGNGHCFLAGRISYTFGFNGPCLTVDTACSSSLVAIHVACQNLRLRECDLAITGGANLMLEPFTTALIGTSHGLAPDGRCKTFDARANGFVRGEGAGIVVLKRLSDARRDGDPILALVRGSAINQDGRSAGIAAPNVKAQEAVLRRALANAQLRPEDIGYVEMHGTGTPLGDPIEAAALKSVLGKPRPDGSKCILGAVKTNIAHLEAAAGIAGFIKVMLVLQHERIPQNLHFNALNPRISFDQTPFTIPRETMEWRRGDKPRYAGVSSFGMSGTNAHIILEEAPLTQPGPPAAPSSSYLLPISAKTPRALVALAQSYAEWLSRTDETSLHDILYTASLRRMHHEHRLAVVARSQGELVDALASFAKGESPPGIVRGSISPHNPVRVVFVFPGQGAQWLDMGRQLLDTEPGFRAALEACDSAIRSESGFSVLEQLTATGPNARRSDIDVAQPLLFALEVALAAQWRSWGVEPSCVIGHSMGEVAAAHVAGILTLHDAVQVICRRSRLLTRLSGQGAMALVELAHSDAQNVLRNYEDRLSIAVSNSPSSTVIAGDPAALEELLTQLEHDGVFCQRLKVDVASHSPQMNQLDRDLINELHSISPTEALIPMRSTVTSEYVRGPELGAAYWSANIRRPVLFSRVVEQCINDGYLLFLELSPHPTLVPFVDEILHSANADGAAIASLRFGRNELQSMLLSLGTLYTHGYPIDWKKQFPGRGNVVPLPAYAWQRERFAIDARSRQIDPIPERGGHPLLGRGVSSASQPGLRIWEQLVTIEEFPYFADHRVRGDVIFPAAAYIEMALAAAKDVYGDQVVTLDDIAFEQMLALPAQTGRRVQLSLEQAGTSRATFAIASKSDEAKEWIRHASGAVRILTSAPVQEENITPAAIQARCPRVIAAREHYAQMEARGLSYGRTFQNVTKVHLGTNEITAEVTIPEDVADHAAAYVVHPALLDACIQAAAWLIHQTNKEATFVPIKAVGVRIFERPSRHVWVHARALANGDESVPTISLVVRNGDGRVILEVGQLRAQALEASFAPAADDPYQNCIFNIEWHKVEPTTAVENSRMPASWLILTDRNLGHELAERLRAQGDRVVIATAADDYAQIDDEHYALNPTASANWERVLTNSFGKAGCQGVIHCGALDGATWQQTSTSTIETDVRRGPISILRLAQALLKQGWRDVPRLYVLTRAAQAVETPRSTLSITQSMIWGMGRAMATEQPELRSVRIDLPAEASSDEPNFVLRELRDNGDEDQIAMRSGHRYVARLVRGNWNGVSTERQEPAANRPYRLEIRQPGVLDRLALRPFNRRPPGPGEVEVEVEAAGLNFLDVLVALGVIPNDLADGDALGPRLGGECAGRIVGIGPDVSDVKIGQEVIALGLSAMATHVVAKRALVIPKPEAMSWTDAATMPIVFLTAYYALAHVGRLRKNERVLIHAGAGGVGMAAIQWARHVGAEIFASAGSDEKRALLKDLGVHHVVDSRSLSFVDDIRRLTDGEGVDVVLNSLSGKFLDASFQLLRDHGRFVEIGKRDYYENRPLGLQPFLKNLTFSLADLRSMMLNRPETVATLLEELVALSKAGVFKPLPCRVFPLSKATDAFALMAQGKHTGKFAFTVKEPGALVTVSTTNNVEIRSDRTYLITGGLGGLGLPLAKWLIGHGAKHLALVGRSEPTPQAANALAEMSAAGAQVHALRGDVAQRSHIDDIFAYVDKTMPPLGGIVHAAGVLADRTIPEMDEERFFLAIKPKVFGAWNLHEATRNRPLDFFIMYSSGAGVIGSPGQVNYAAANTFLDALGHARVADGLAGMSIQWGNFADVGLAASSDIRGNRIAARGSAAFKPGEGTLLFGRLLAQPRPEVSIMHFDVRQWMDFYPHIADAPFFVELMREKSHQSSSAAGSIRADLDHAAPAQRLGILEAHLLEQLGKVLRLDPSRIDKRTPFVNLGIDSLMSLEFRNRLEASLGIKLSVALLFSYSTTIALANHLLERLFPAASPPSGSAAERTTPDSDFEASTLGGDPLEQQDEAALVDRLGELEEYLK